MFSCLGLVSWVPPKCRLSWTRLQPHLGERLQSGRTCRVPSVAPIGCPYEASSRFGAFRSFVFLSVGGFSKVRKQWLFMAVMEHEGDEWVKGV